MSLNEKRDRIIQCVKLGMEWLRAALVAECTEEEIDELENDANFMHKIQVNDAIEEVRLLEKHNDAISEAVVRGSATAVQWKLEHINPGRWGSKELYGLAATNPTDIVINLVGRKSDGSEC